MIRLTTGWTSWFCIRTGYVALHFRLGSKRHLRKVHFDEEPQRTSKNIWKPTRRAIVYVCIIRLHVYKLAVWSNDIDVYVHMQVSACMHETLHKFQIIHTWHWICKIRALSSAWIRDCYIFKLSEQNSSDIKLLHPWIFWIPLLTAYVYYGHIMSLKDIEMHDLFCINISWFEFSDS